MAFRRETGVRGVASSRRDLSSVPLRVEKLFMAELRFSPRAPAVSLAVGGFRILQCQSSHAGNLILGGSMERFPPGLSAANPPLGVQLPDSHPLGKKAAPRGEDSRYFRFPV